MPAMLRVATASGAPAETVMLSKTWHPSGRREEVECRTAAGLCFVPWLGMEARLSVQVSAAEGTASVEIARDRADAGRVHEIRLSDALVRDAAE
jgi:hypothetical protein